MYIFSERRHYDNFPDFSFIRHLELSFGTFWNLLEKGGGIWISIWEWTWIWVKSGIEIEFELNLKVSEVFEKMFWYPLTFFEPTQATQTIAYVINEWSNSTNVFRCPCRNSIWEKIDSHQRKIWRKLGENADIYFLWNHWGHRWSYGHQVREIIVHGSVHKLRWQVFSLFVT